MTAILFKPQSGKWILPGSHPQSLLHPTSGMKTILTWPSGLCELSFSNCDNRKSHREPWKKNAHCAGSLMIATEVVRETGLQG